MNFEKLPELEVRPRPEGERGRRLRWLVVGLMIAVGAGVLWWAKRPEGGSEGGRVAGAGQDREEVAQLAGRVDDLLEVAAERSAVGRWEEAEEALTESAELQREINERFAGRPEASAEKLHGIEGERQTVLAHAVLAEVARLDALAAEHLRRREIYQAQRVIAQGWEQVEAAVVDFPLARGMDEELRLRLGWLLG